LGIFWPDRELNLNARLLGAEIGAGHTNISKNRVAELESPKPGFAGQEERAPPPATRDSEFGDEALAAVEHG